MTLYAPKCERASRPIVSNGMRTFQDDICERLGVFISQDALRKERDSDHTSSDRTGKHLTRDPEALRGVIG